MKLSSTSSVDERLHYERSVMLKNGVRKIELAQPLYEKAIYLAALAIFLAIAFLLSIILTAIIGSRVSRKMLNPIYDMTNTVRSISGGELSTRLDVVDSHDELKDLALTFNEMLDRIQTSFEQQNVFVSNASHELRTPIAVVQGYANLLNRWGKEDKAVLEESINAIKSESDFMMELVEKLLFLASADKQGQAMQKEAFNLDELIDEVLKETRLIDEEHQIMGDVNEKIMVNGDRSLIKQALRVFIDNSIKYTPAAGSIKLNSRLMDSNVLITIEDTGIGISREDLPYIFNRFYKSDKARTRENSGAGLGLSIAKLIIENHQGRIQVESSPGQGTRVSIMLPGVKQRNNRS
ncbi:MAG: HAMP domain-containing protein [Syntrophomonadaceae bacterium]|nr:HAMP domain-containing protein [Syntrophomonadaceae bacterium]